MKALLRADVTRYRHTRRQGKGSAHPTMMPGGTPSFGSVLRSQRLRPHPICPTRPSPLIVWS